MKNLKERRKKREKDSEEHILPLINVVFLLLIFFMIAGRLTTSDPFEVAPAKSISTREIDQEEAIIHLDSQGNLAFQNAEVSREELIAQVAAYLKGNKFQTLKLKADENSSAGRALVLIEDLKKIGVEKVNLITELEAGQ